MIYSTEEYNQIFDRLPSEIQDVIESYDTSKKMWAIGQKHRLHIDDIGKLNDIILDVMMGITASKDFIDEIVKEIKISKLDASAIVHDVNEEIFKPIKEIMVRVYGESAPFKPKTLRTTQANEDHADELSSDELLREIETPEPLKVRKINNSTNIEAIVTFGEQKREAYTPIPSVKIETDNINISDALKQKRDRILNLIASKKLSSVTTMNDVRNVEDSRTPSPSVYTPPIKEDSFIPKTVQKPEIPVQNVVPETKPRTPEPVETPVAKPEPKPFANIVDPFRN